MKSVTFKNSGLVLPKLGYGAMGITAFYGPPMPDAEALPLLKGVLDLGISHFDTAEIYKTGNPFEPSGEGVHNESVLGAFFATIADRSSYTVATKFQPYAHDSKCDKATVEASFSASLQRLGLGYVDVYYCHRMPPTIEALDEWMAAAKGLVESGRVRHIGLSEVGPEWLRRAHAIHPVACIQQEWSLLTRLLETTLVPVCVELGIGIVAYSPLGRNLVTLTKDSVPPPDWRATNPRFKDDAFEKNKALGQRVHDLAAGAGATAAQVCLAWLYRRADELGVAVVPIPGSTRLSNVTANAKAVDVRLSDGDYTALTTLGLEVVGARGSDEYAARALEGQLSK